MNPMREAMILGIVQSIHTRDRQYLLEVMETPNQNPDKIISIQIYMIDGRSVTFECNCDDTIADVIKKYRLPKLGVEPVNINLYSTIEGENKIPDNTKINTFHKNSDGIIVFFALPIPQMRNAILIKLKIEINKQSGMCYCDDYESSSLKISKIQVSSEIVCDDVLTNEMEEKQEYHLNKCNLPECITVWDGLEVFDKIYDSYQNGENILVLI